MILTNFSIHAAQFKNKLKNSTMNNNRAKVKYLQQSSENTEGSAAPTADDDGGNALDGQVIVIEGQAPPTEAQTVDTAPAQTLEDLNEDNMDDRLNQALAVTGEQSDEYETFEEEEEIAAAEEAQIIAESEPVVEQPVAEPQIITIHATEEEIDEAVRAALAEAATTTAVETSSNDYNYHLDQWDSSVKHQVYPDEDDSMVNWGVAMVGSFLALIFIIKVVTNWFGSSSFFSMRPYKMKAVYAILRDLAIFIFILSILLA